MVTGIHISYTMYIILGNNGTMYSFYHCYIFKGLFQLSFQAPLINNESTPAASFQCSSLIYPASTSITVPSSACDVMINWHDVAITWEQAQSLEERTRDQAKCREWHEERSKRITASNFGKVMKRKAKITDKFLQSIMTPTSFTAAATCYGTSNEGPAKVKYQKQTGCHVHDCGFVVNPDFPFLGASPDGKVCDNGSAGLLEVKCPYSIRDWEIADAVLHYEKPQQLCLEMVNDNIALKKDHNYYFQIQGQLLVTGASFCDFVCYTKNSLFVDRILPDPDVMENIMLKLFDVYTAFKAF